MNQNVITENSTAKPQILSMIVFFLVSLTVLTAFTVPFSWEGVVVLLVSYFVRMFGITAGFHRYFSHNSYKTSRVFQFVLAWIGTSAMQKGPLWWAAHHRDHHKYSDTEKDLHSPRKGFWHSHMLWFLKSDFNDYDPKNIKDYSKYPELVFIDKHYWLPPVSLAVFLYLAGGWLWLVYGYAIATFLLGHGTWTINSLSHVFGKQRFETGDDSRNNWFLAIITMGEGWHNNHHYYRHSANQGFYWYEFDMSFYILKLLGWTGLIWDLKKPPVHVMEEGFKRDAIRKGKEKFKSPTGEWIKLPTPSMARSGS
ncbi:MAG: acyl-CoA desaturase [Leptospira sp.]|nr:acyl-CoA desaturase [Leptospira sp.]